MSAVRQWFSVTIFASLCAVTFSTAPRAADCAAEVAHFNAAVDEGREAEAAAAVGAIATDALCGRFQVAVQRRLAAFKLNAAQELMERGRPPEEYERDLLDAARPGVLWQAAATLAEVRFGARRFDEAAMNFDAAIEEIKNETLTPMAPSKAEIQGLIDRAAQSRVLEANIGSAHKPATYVVASNDKRDGTVGGYLSPSVRGIVPHALPLPIIFDFDKATLSPIGEDAVRDLVRAVIEQQPAKVTVVGHTDVRGGEQYNEKLSRDRAEAVADFMRHHGVEAPIEATGVGSKEPMRVDDSSGLTQDDIYALNRRVDWVRD